MTSRLQSIADVLGRPPVHPFPARMDPGLAIGALERLPENSTVLDPMMGSGTVVALARAMGHRGIGFDVDPLSVLISRVWTRPLNADRAWRSAIRVVTTANRTSSRMRQADAYPRDADDETRHFIRYWFDPRSRCQLAALAKAIEGERNTGVRDALWCGFSRLIISKQAGASRAMDLSHSRPHRAFETAPIRPLDHFLGAMDRVIQGCVPHGEFAGPPSCVGLGDARRLRVESRSVDLVFTSPPYLNAIDYLRCSKFTLVWMGHPASELRAIRSSSIGTEAGGASSDEHSLLVKRLGVGEGLPNRVRGYLYRYAADLRVFFDEVQRVLTPNGRATVVIGENTLRGEFLPTGKLASHIAEAARLKLESRRWRGLPASKRYLPPPQNGKSAFSHRMRREVILTFRLA
jgi:hypothetical protein